MSPIDGALVDAASALLDLEGARDQVRSKQRRRRWWRWLLALLFAVCGVAALVTMLFVL